MECIEEFAERYSEVNEAKLFIERFKHGDLPVEYIPSGFRINIDEIEIVGLINSYSAINEEEYNRILCTYYVKYLNEKYFNNQWILDKIPCKPSRNKYYFNDNEIDFYDLYNLLIESISNCRSFEECEKIRDYNALCDDEQRKIIQMITNNSENELEIKDQDKNLKLNDYYVLKRHPELAYLYSDELIYQRIIAIRDIFYNQSIPLYSKSTTDRDALIKTIDELSILNEELKRRKEMDKIENKKGLNL